MCELLSPAGDFSSLRQAVINGCDAVYVGGIKFGARKYATNFTNEELVKAIRYCHLYNVKIYVTVNTIIYEKELPLALEYVEFLYRNQVDALIMQDIGLIKQVREKYPDLEIHASTQLHNHNKEGLLLLKELGVKRVVLARELSLDEINKIDVDIEKEVFIHGALCVCYSGQCLFSSVLLNRSGNRGSCAGFCRLPYDLYEESQKINLSGKYLLSPKELNTSYRLDKLLESNIASFKIEGRMKSPTYVGFITRFYRKIIDNYQKYKKILIDDEDIKKLMILYNREFTDGFLFDAQKSLMNIKSPNHQGLEIGHVLEVNKNKIKIGLIEDLNQGDGIRFSENNNGGIVNFLYNNKNRLINRADKGSIVYLDNKYDIKSNCLVLKTSDIKLAEEYESLKDLTIPIKMKVTALINKPLKIEISKENIKVESSSGNVNQAINSPTSKDTIKRQVTKLGNTPFTCEEIEVLSDENIFLSIKELNDLRRNAVKLLEEKLINRDRKTTIKEVIETKKNHAKRFNTLAILVKTKEQLEVALQKNVDRIYIEDESIYNKYKHLDNIYLKLPRVIKNSRKYQNANLLVSELGALKRYDATNSIVTDTYLNVTNHSMVDYLLKHNAKTVTLSLENTIEDIKDITSAYLSPPDLEIIVYTRVELMIMKYCPLNYLLKQEGPCNLCKDKKYYLKDRNNAFYPLEHRNCLTTILNSEVTNNISKIKEYQRFGITSFRLELYDEDSIKTEELISKCLEFF